MGNHPHAIPLTTPSATSFTFPEHPTALVKQLMSQSCEQHQQYLTLIADLQQLTHSNVLSIVQFQTVKAHNLCSVISQIYLAIERPKYSLRELRQKEGKVEGQQIMRIVAGCARGIGYLRKAGFQFGQITQDMVYIDEQKNGDLTAKIMNPCLKDQEMQSSYRGGTTLQHQLADLITPLALNSDLEPVFRQMRQGELTLQDLESIGGQKRGRSGLKLTRDLRMKNKRESKISNGSSLLIDGGNESDLMFKDFYEHFDDDISQISVNYTDRSTFYDQDSWHQFPKKYLRGKAFRKTDKTCNSSYWLSSRQCPSEWKQTEIGTATKLLISQDFKVEPMTRDQSIRDNMRIDSYSMLESARLAESHLSPRFP